MKQVSHRGYLLVEVPEDAYDFEILELLSMCLHFWVGQGYDNDDTIIDLPEGNWEIIGKGNEIKEQVCKGIVQYDIHPMEDYVIGYTDYDLDDDNVLLDTAKKSLDSLIKSHGMKPEQCLILKLINTNT